MATEKPSAFAESANLDSSPRLEVSGGSSGPQPCMEDQPRVNGLPVDRGQRAVSSIGDLPETTGSSRCLGPKKQGSTTGMRSASSVRSNATLYSNASVTSTAGMGRTPSTRSTRGIKMAKTLSTVAAGHGKAGGTVIKTVCESGKPTTILKVLDETELQVYQHLAKIKQDPISKHVAQFVGVVEVPEDNRKYIRIRNLLQDFIRPKVMDVKLGLRTFQESECTNSKLRPDLYERMCELYPDELKSEDHAKKAVTKFRWMTTRDAQSTIGILGYRIDGVAGLGQEQVKEDITATIPRAKTMDDTVAMIRKFIEGDLPDDASVSASPHAIAKMLAEQLRALRTAMENSSMVTAHEFIGSSLLLLLDETGNTGVFWIDFAKTKLLPIGVEITHRTQWLMGNCEDGIMFGMDNIIQAMDTVAANLAVRYPDRGTGSGNYEYYSDSFSVDSHLSCIADEDLHTSTLSAPRPPGEPVDISTSLASTPNFTPKCTSGVTTPTPISMREYRQKPKAIVMRPGGTISSSANISRASSSTLAADANTGSDMADLAILSQLPCFWRGSDAHSDDDLEAECILRHLESDAGLNVFNQEVEEVDKAPHRWRSALAYIQQRMMPSGMSKAFSSTSSQNVRVVSQDFESSGAEASTTTRGTRGTVRASRHRCCWGLLSRKGRDRKSVV